MLPFFSAISSLGLGLLAASAANFSASLVSADAPLASAAAAFVMMSWTKRLTYAGPDISGSDLSLLLELSCAGLLAKV